MSNSFEALCQKLNSYYEPREAGNIARLLFESVGIKGQALNKAVLSEEAQIALDQAAERLLKGEPIQYILGQADFYGYVFRVNPAVLIPRPETEELIYRALSIAATLKDPMLKVLDIGTGSGCIPITLKKEAPTLSITAIEVSPEALVVAKKNAKELEADIQFLQLDFTDNGTWSKLEQYHLIVSNPPYIPWKEKALVGANVLGQEPNLALFVEDKEPLLFYRLIAEFADTHLIKGGAILVETNQYNASEVLALFQSKGFTEAFLFEDLMGNDRIVLARK